MYCGTTTKSTNIVIINTASLWSYDGSSGGDCVIGAYLPPHSAGDSGDGGWMICAHPPPHSTTTVVNPFRLRTRFGFGRTKKQHKPASTQQEQKISTYKNRERKKKKQSK